MATTNIYLNFNGNCEEAFNLSIKSKKHKPKISNLPALASDSSPSIAK